MYHATSDEAASLASSKPESISRSRKAVLMGLATVAAVSTGAFIGFKTTQSTDVESSQAQEGSVFTMGKKGGRDGSDGNDCPSYDAICKTYKVDLDLVSAQGEEAHAAGSFCGIDFGPDAASAECSVKCCHDEGTICRVEDNEAALGCQLGCLFDPFGYNVQSAEGEEEVSVKNYYGDYYDSKVDCKEVCSEWCACPGGSSNEFDDEGIAILFDYESGYNSYHPTSELEWARSRLAIGDYSCGYNSYIELDWRADKRGPLGEETCEVERAFPGGLYHSKDAFKSCVKACQPVCKAWDEEVNRGYNGRQ